MRLHQRPMHQQKYKISLELGNNISELNGINMMPETPNAKKAYKEIVTDGNFTSIARVARSLPAKKVAPSNAKIEAGIKFPKPGRRISKTPRKPTKTAVHLRQPTFSLKKIAAPIVTNKGMT